MYRVTKQAIIILLPLVAGCDDPQPIHFMKESLDLGVVEEGQMLQAVFPFTVESASNVKIREIKTSCGCMNANLDIAETNLSTGDNEPIRIAMNTQGRIGRLSAQALIIFEGSSYKPIPLSVSVEVRQRPKIVTGIPIVVTEQILRKICFNVEVKYRFLLAEEPLSLDLDRSNFGPFQLVKTSMTTSEKIAAPGILARDQKIVLSFEHEPLESTCDMKSDIELNWKGKNYSLLMPVEIYVGHPVTLSQDRIYAGKCKPGQSIHREIDLRSDDADLIFNAVIASDDRAISTHFSPDSNKLFIDMKAPKQPGRFESSLRITFAKERLPPLIVVLSGLVENR